jgi:hypothetical protein
MPIFYIQNPWTKLVIDIGVNETSPARGTLLRANALSENRPGPFQLWQLVVPINSQFGWNAIQNVNVNLVIDIQLKNVPENTLPPAGTRLDAWTEKEGDEGNANQLWSFEKDSSGFYFIHSNLSQFAIDIEEHGLPPGQSPPSGSHLDAWPRKGGSSPQNTGNRNQLWQLIEPGGAIFVPPPTLPGPIVPPAR